MAGSVTKIELVGIYLCGCPKCYKLPYIGYDGEAVTDNPFIIGCPDCKELIKGSSIPDVTHRWNMHVVETDDDIADMEGLDV